jgi:hypothetical protein
MENCATDFLNLAQRGLEAKGSAQEANKQKKRRALREFSSVVSD